MKKDCLLPPEVRATIPKLYQQEGVGDPMVYVKLYNPYGIGTWLLIEYDGQDIAFCYVDLLESEMGYVSVRELESMPAYINGKWYDEIPGIERDLYFTPRPLSKALKTLNRQELEAKSNV